MLTSEEFIKNISTETIYNYHALSYLASSPWPGIVCKPDWLCNDDVPRQDRCRTLQLPFLKFKPKSNCIIHFKIVTARCWMFKSKSISFEANVKSFLFFRLLKEAIVRHWSDLEKLLLLVAPWCSRGKTLWLK